MYNCRQVFVNGNNDIISEDIIYEVSNEDSLSDNIFRKSRKEAGYINEGASGDG